jgi:SAM-dependent methyltransferase
VADWSKGYVADIGYTAAFYRETAPAHMAFAALSLGKSAGRAAAPKRYLEIGFGQGFGLALLAAANPDVAFEGYDFNPAHMAHIGRLIAGAGLQNLAVSEVSFEDAAARGGAADLDVISLHGILSWVGADSRAAIVEIARQRLQPDGIVYASYNCMPGWAPIAPIRQLMMQVKRRRPGSSEAQLAAGIDILNRLRSGGAGFFAANPVATRQIDEMAKYDRAYLAHEYLDEHWTLFEMPEVAALFQQAKLDFHASATLLENLDQYAVPEVLRPLVAETHDPVFREVLRDYAGNRRFRRDVYARGVAAPTTAEHRKMLAGLSFVLTVPRANVTLRFAGPLSELTAKVELHGPILDALAGGPAGFDALLEVFPASGNKVPMLLDCLCLLVSSGQVLPLVVPPAADPAPAQRFNRHVIDNLKAGRLYNAVASPVARTGLPVGEFDLLAMMAAMDGKDDLPGAARHAHKVILGMGRHPIRDGRLLTAESEALAFLEERIAAPFTAGLPVWKLLGVL